MSRCHQDFFISCCLFCGFVTSTFLAPTFVLNVETKMFNYLNFYKKFIIKGIKMAIPELKISSLAFRVAGSDIKLNDNYEEDVEKSWKKMEEKLDAQEEAVKKYLEKKLSESGF